MDDAELEAEILLAHTLDFTREQLLARQHEPPGAERRERFDSLMSRRLAHEPLAYITGHREFYGIDLLCSPAALIPRPETEMLVELALDWVRGQGSGVNEPTIIDVGTGSGAIAIAIAVHAPNARVIAIDTSRAALELARENARRHGVDHRISFVQGSLLTPLRVQADIVVANLPYIAEEVYASLPPEIREHEPECALRAGARGTEVIEELIAQAPTLLAPGALLLAEHAWDQGKPLRGVARASFPHARIETARDLAGLERVLSIAF
jgi:release factor glutamine methyltransferase